MISIGKREEILASARAYERALPPEQRKRLGQFFSGLRLGKLLAHLALGSDTRTVLDPMAGHGDLLDGAWEAARARGVRLDRLDGIEIDPATAAACTARLTHLVSGVDPTSSQVLARDAFDPGSIGMLPYRAYDLVVTNPPYVRYQARNGGSSSDHKIRSSLIAVVDSLTGEDRHVWKHLVRAYSGLADLSVPAWLLSALMVEPGGRLALVVPSTWRSRDYGNVTRYLLLRCFALEYVVEDSQPGWFSDALVRTHLVVARRLNHRDAARPLNARASWPSALWIHVAPEAADEHSLVGAAFVGDQPERQFVEWLHSGCSTARAGIRVRRFPLEDERQWVASRCRTRRWYQQLEHHSTDLPLFASDRRANSAPVIPEALRDLLPRNFTDGALVTLEEAGIQVGQGLRTGCNVFFYVRACGPAEDGMVCVQASSFFGRRKMVVPADAIRPVLMRQSAIASFERCASCDGRVLDLRQWVMPEDAPLVTQAAHVYAARGQALPRTMFGELAAYVREAAGASPPGDGGKRIPMLSAVRTNVRPSRGTGTTPRFWYMLPDFAPRHLPRAFVPRVNSGLAWVVGNCNPPIVIDANFSTFWASDGRWSSAAIKALLNSAWCRACMEAVGTPLGGGALKLEATHLRGIPVPVLTDEAIAELNEAGLRLARNSVELQQRVDSIVLGAIFSRSTAQRAVPHLATAIKERALSISAARQRAA